MEGAALTSALAAQRTSDYAAAMLRLAQTSPEAFSTMAETAGIPREQWPRVLAGDIPDSVWDILADRALDTVQPPQATGPAPAPTG